MEPGNEAMTREFAEACTILRGTVGSTAHGLNLIGNDDLDEMGICIEPLEEVIKLEPPFEQFIFRSATERTGKQDARSEVGDLDLTIFSLRKFCKLAASGNPTVLLMFFTPQISVKTKPGEELLNMTNLFVSKEAGKRFLGYMHGQRLRLLGEKGQKRVKRPELEEKYGYDTKYAMHVLRLGIQGRELITTGKLTLPMEQQHISFLMDVRHGKFTLDDIVRKAAFLEDRLEFDLQTSSLPDYSDRPAIEAWMQKVYLDTWKEPH